SSEPFSTELLDPIFGHVSHDGECEQRSLQERGQIVEPLRQLRHQSPRGGEPSRQRSGHIADELIVLNAAALYVERLLNRFLQPRGAIGKVLGLLVPKVELQVTCLTPVAGFWFSVAPEHLVQSANEALTVA